MDKLILMTLYLVKASSGNPVIATATIILFYIMFNIVEAIIETVIFGHRFEHYLDILFSILFMIYAAYTVYLCAVYKDQGDT